MCSTGVKTLDRWILQEGPLKWSYHSVQEWKEPFLLVDNSNFGFQFCFIIFRVK
jgi:hypothetical protein